MNKYETTNEDIDFLPSTLAFTIPLLKYYALNAIIIDARQGGLVLGEPHPKEGVEKIHLLELSARFEVLMLGLVPEPNMDEVFAIYRGSIEGGEYILSREAIEKYERRFDEINSDLSPSESLKQIPLTQYTKIINAYGDEHKYLLIKSNWAVVNKHATARNLAELELMNALVL
jgi:hypothetical protein